MKYFIIANVYSHYNLMISALRDAGFDENNTNHTLVSLGNLLNKGNDPVQCLNYVNSLERKILIRGYEEDLIERTIWNEQITFNEYLNGVSSTLSIIAGSPEIDFYNIDNYVCLSKYLDSLVNYKETSHYVFLNNWIPCNALKVYSDGEKMYTNIDDWRNCNSTDWIIARNIDNTSAYKCGITDFKTICCVTNNIDDFVVYHESAIMIKSSPENYKKITCIILEEPDV